MSGAVVALPTGRERERGRERTAVAAAAGDWPRTTRVLPWSIAGFLTMVFLVPFDVMTLPVHLPFNSTLDRGVVGAMVLIWLGAALVAGKFAPRFVRSPLNWAVGAFLGAAILSVVANAHRLMLLGEFQTSLKKIVLLVVFVAFYFLVASIVRPTEVRAFVLLVIGLSCITAVGTIIEYRTGLNVFFSWGSHLLPPGFSLAPQPENDPFGRANITGPTQHGLVDALMLTIGFALALTQLLAATERSARIKFALATAVILAGAFATGRKTGLVVPVFVVLAIVAMRPRQAIKLAPVGVVMVLAMPVISPGALGSLRNQLMPGSFDSSNSTQGRTADYAAVQPDLGTHPVVGRGYGSYDPHKYRLIDNQYLGLAIETGGVGVAAYLILLLAVIGVTRQARRSDDPARGPPALAAAAVAVAVGVAAALFDVYAYPQVPYVFMFVAGLAAVCSSSAAPGSGRPGVAASRALRP
jgi:O-antigen ligase/polysaccharide polymerase Wzy-like membrane protein